jgi:hypothetical protein
MAIHVFRALSEYGKGVLARTEFADTYSRLSGKKFGEESKSSPHYQAGKKVFDALDICPPPLAFFSIPLYLPFALAIECRRNK